jgi:hypothetical protein
MRFTTHTSVSNVLTILLLSMLANVALTQAAQAANIAPTISGTPPTTARVQSWYKFVPVASDLDKAPRALRFRIANKPSWANFSIYSGTLSGAPPTTSTWSNIRITVTDGSASVSLPAFRITGTTGATTTPTPTEPTVPSGTNIRPTISGAPATTARVRSWYKFVPVANDADQAPRALRFSIANKPSWANFSIYSGTLSGAAPTTNTWSNIRITVTDGSASASLPAFSITGTTGATTTPTPTEPTTPTAPRISGTPTTTVRSGTAYSFTPTASDANGDPLVFSVLNRPSWATFSTTNGRLSGAPTSAQVGTYYNIAIRVSDGNTTVSLPAFAITVTDVATGSATLSWVPPTRNSDGSALTNLAGYRIYYGTSSSALNQTVQLSNPGLSSYVIGNLAPATYYFSVRSYNTSGAESAGSNVASKVIR